jgi:hypothetical protein
MGAGDMEADVPNLQGEPFVSDWSGSDHPTTDIVEAIATATDQEVHELTPLQEYIDGDAIESLLQNTSTSASISFVYDDTYVRASSDGTISVWTT